MILHVALPSIEYINETLVIITHKLGLCELTRFVICSLRVCALSAAKLII